MNELINWIKAEGEGHWLFIAFPVVLLCLFLWLILTCTPLIVSLSVSITGASEFCESFQ